jgi:hypothetical protein
MRRRPCKGRGGEHLYPGRPGATRSTLSTPAGSFPSSGGSARLVRLGPGTAGRLARLGVAHAASPAKITSRAVICLYRLCLDLPNQEGG